MKKFWRPVLKRTLIMLSVIGLTASGMSGIAQAITVYGNNAGSAGIEIFNVNVAAGTAAETNQYAPVSGNGRGVVVVGDIVYSTVVGDNHIYKIDRLTGALIGSITTGQASMSTIAYDGTNFWTTDYAGSNKGFYIDANTGATLKTVTFSEATGFMDGMEYFNGKLIVNRTDGGFGGAIAYDVYDLNGTLLTKNFFTAQNGTGVAYDGTNFLVSDIYGNQLHVFNGTTGAFIRDISLGTTGHLIEDLSVDYAARQDTGGGNGGGNNVPEPASLLLLGAGIAGIGVLKRRTQA